MKLLYLGDLPATDTLQRLFVLGEEICFLDHPSVMIPGQWGTVRRHSAMRPFNTGTDSVRLSVHEPPGQDALSVYEYYARSDLLNEDFVRSFLDGLKNNEKFSFRCIQPTANYGDGLTGIQLRQRLISDQTLYQTSFDLAETEHSSMYQSHTPEGRKAISKTLLLTLSIQITSALLMADKLAAVPVADDNVLLRLLALRLSSPKYIGGTSSVAPFLGLQFVRAAIPDELMRRLDFKNIFEYRNNAKDIYVAWSTEINSTAAKIDDVDFQRDPNGAVQKIVATELMPKLGEYEREMAAIRDKMFGDLMKSIIKWEFPALSLGYIANLGFTGALAAFAAGARAAVPHLVDYVTASRAAKRNHAVSYLVGLTKK
jgi:hypothetical protein